jgi:hypothetical protein
MLRTLVIVLMLANLGFYGWTQGGLTEVLGLSPDGDREPQRLANQVDPTALRVLTPGAPTRPNTAASAATPAQAQIPAPEASAPPNPADNPEAAAVCLEAGPFTPVEWRLAENALRNTLGEGPWQLTTREKPGSWMVYVGPYKSSVIMDKRADQLRRLEIAFEEPQDLPEEYLPGFLFGRYGVEADARALQARLTAQKVKYVRVVALVKPTALHTVRIPKADADIQERVAALQPRLSGHTFAPCKRP